MGRISIVETRKSKEKVTIMSLMTDAGKMTPRRVLRRAAELGVHADCIAADFDGSCQSCVELVHNVFNEFYGHAKSADEALQLIIDDILTDRGWNV